MAQERAFVMLDALQQSDETLHNKRFWDIALTGKVRVSTDATNKSRALRLRRRVMDEMGRLCVECDEIKIHVTAKACRSAGSALTAGPL